MEEGETLSDTETQPMPTAIDKETSMTFDDVKTEAWNMSQEALTQWKMRLERRVAEKMPDITQHLKDLSTLYGIDVPESVVVSLQYYPQDGTHKGEPINNWVENGRLEEDFADVIYWLPDPNSIPEEATDDVLKKVLHETQHISFGGEKFQELVRKSEQNPEVAEVLKKLKRVSGSYVEVTTELVVTYLENLFTKRTHESPRDESTVEVQPLITFEVDKGKFGRVLEAVIKEDVESLRDRGRGPGPSTKLRQSWENILGGLPSGYETRKEETNVTKKVTDESYKGARIYELAGELDTSLAERYLEEGKEIDEAFIIELYKMADVRLKMPTPPP